MYITVCDVCEKQFERIDEKRERNICYRCALKELCGNFAPEEGDFNSALIISGEMNEKEWKMLQEDLRSVELGYSLREPDDEYEDPRDDVYRNRDGR